MMETEDEARVSLDEAFSSDDSDRHNRPQASSAMGKKSASAHVPRGVHRSRSSYSRDKSRVRRKMRAAVHRVRMRNEAENAIQDEVILEDPGWESDFEYAANRVRRQGGYGDGSGGSACASRSSIGVRFARWRKRHFGTWSPMIGDERWEAVGTSWLLPDMMYLVLRFVMFAAVVGGYVVLAQRQQLWFKYYATDVFLAVLVSSSVLLMPPVCQLIAGPHEDELDAPNLRWVWTVITMVYQTALTSVVFLLTAYWTLVRGFGSWTSQATASADLWSEIVLYGVSAVGVGTELALSNIQLRLSYAMGGFLLTAMYIAVVIDGNDGGRGQWLHEYLSRRSGTGVGILGAASVEVVARHFALFAVYWLSVLAVIAAERARTRMANWIEMKRDMDFDAAW